MAQCMTKNKSMLIPLCLLICSSLFFVTQSRAESRELNSPTYALPHTTQLAWHHRHWRHHHWRHHNYCRYHNCHRHHWRYWRHY